jgi:hypothetical protein
VASSTKNHALAAVRVRLGIGGQDLARRYDGAASWREDAPSSASEIQPSRVLRVNLDWAIGELDRFLGLLEYQDRPGPYAATYVGTDDEIAAQKVVVERIWDRVIGPQPVVPRSSADPYRPDRDWTIRCRQTIIREEEIRENLGEDAPDLSAAKMHPWVWEGARSLWQSGHFAEAVEAAGKKVNAEAQNKSGRRDVSETDLFVQLFSDDSPQVGKSRLRLKDDDGGKTATSHRRGVRCFAEGWFAGVRNPTAHEVTELEETEALERLASLSLLARWVDGASLES